MGEFQYSRYPEDEWEEEILKMKAGGVQIVPPTFSGFIARREGKLDSSGQRDLGQFVRLCKKHEMYVYLRIGPWVHGEPRMAGFLTGYSGKAQRGQPILHF